MIQVEGVLDGNGVVVPALLQAEEGLLFPDVDHVVLVVEELSVVHKHFHPQFPHRLGVLAKLRPHLRLKHN